MALFFSFISFTEVHWFANNRSWLFTWRESGFLGWGYVAHRPMRRCWGARAPRCCSDPARGTTSVPSSPDPLCCVLSSPSLGGPVVLAVLSLQAALQPPGGRNQACLLPSSLLEARRELRWPSSAEHAEQPHSAGQSSEEIPFLPGHGEWSEYWGMSVTMLMASYPKHFIFTALQIYPRWENNFLTQGRWLSRARIWL